MALISPNGSNLRMSDISVGRQGIVVKWTAATRLWFTGVEPDRLSEASEF